MTPGQCLLMLVLVVDDTRAVSVDVGLGVGDTRAVSVDVSLGCW